MFPALLLLATAQATPKDALRIFNSTLQYCYEHQLREDPDFIDRDTWSLVMTLSEGTIQSATTTGAPEPLGPCLLRRLPGLAGLAPASVVQIGRRNDQGIGWLVRHEGDTVHVEVSCPAGGAPQAVWVQHTGGQTAVVEGTLDDAQARCVADVLALAGLSGRLHVTLPGAE